MGREVTRAEAPRDLDDRGGSVAASDPLAGDALDELQVRARLARFVGGGEGRHHARRRRGGSGGHESQQGLLKHALTGGERGDMAQSGVQR